MRAKIEDDGGIEALYGHEALVLWEDEKNYITIQNNFTGDTKTLSSDYLIGADGGVELRQKTDGFKLKSLGKSIHFLIVDINAPRSALQLGKEFDAGGTDYRSRGKEADDILAVRGQEPRDIQEHFQV